VLFVSLLLRWFPLLLSLVAVLLFRAVVVLSSLAVALSLRLSVVMLRGVALL
jgi:hypothetical protein